ncbi:MAG: hypothetical protein QGF74_00890 [Candidatus Nanoarchaeia archaeon]|jgi:Zn-dependent protease|nr:hypothetical protein [Candidatus Nanoarchaeia archaeon]|tara:strand:- start:13737 stop:14462 length:726 start_codon:yes stop_codon:yes gene_type:complete
MKINKIELKHFVITIFFVTFALAFDDKKSEFILNSWLLNFLKVLIFVSITVIVHYFGHKLAARKYQTEVEHRIWCLSNLLFKKIKKKIPIGIILSLLVSFFSLGRLFFIAIESITINTKPKRTGFRYPNLMDYEIAIISVAGPLANLILALFIKLIGISFLNDLIMINLAYGLFHMIPFSDLDGCKVFFSSFIVYIFTLSLMLITLLLISFYSLTTVIILALFIAAVFSIIFFLFLFGKHL